MTERTARNFSRLTRALQATVVFAALFNIFDVLSPLLISELTLALETDQGIWIRKIGDFPWKHRVAFAAMASSVSLLWLYAIYQVHRLCGIFRRGVVFVPETFRRIKRFGVALCLMGPAGTLAFFAIVRYLGWSGLLEGRAGAYDVFELLESMDLLLGGLLMMLFAAVMERAVELSEDQRLTV